MKRIPEGQTPAEVADLIQDVIKGKVVCDIGCGGGAFMVELARYAKEVKGIEEEPEWAEHAANRGFSIYKENAFSYPLPEADVYYCWNKTAMGIYLKAKFEGTKGTFIFGHTVRKCLLDLIATLDHEEREVDGFKIWITQL